MIDQMERMNALLDAYEQLLTEKQREILNLYYKEDLSFSEIAEMCIRDRYYFECHADKQAAMRREYQIKQLSRSEKLKLKYRSEDV